MQSIDEAHSERLNLEQPKCASLTWASIFVCLFGIGWFYIPISALDMSLQTQNIIGIAIIAFGVLTLLFRRGAGFDKESGIVTKWWGFFIPLFKSARRVTPQAVHIGHESHRYRGQTTHWYPVTLICVGGRIELFRPTSVMPAWSRAQNLACYLDVELIDETEGPAPFQVPIDEYQSPQELDQNLGDALLVEKTLS